MGNLLQVGKIIAKVPRLVWLNLILTIVMETVVQIVWKSTALSLPESAGLIGTVRAVIFHPMLYLLLGLFAIQFISWIILLAKTDLSYAQPIAALSLVSVAVCSALFLGEKVGVVRMGGIVIILVGVWLISNTEHSTRAKL
jgi:drug/metabolite transporter (DMT)-like permease